MQHECKARKGEAPGFLLNISVGSAAPRSESLEVSADEVPGNEVDRIREGRSSRVWRLHAAELDFFGGGPWLPGPLGTKGSGRQV